MSACDPQGERRLSASLRYADTPTQTDVRARVSADIVAREGPVRPSPTKLHQQWRKRSCVCAALARRTSLTAAV
jgi:hypothetical protein